MKGKHLKHFISWNVLQYDTMGKGAIIIVIIIKVLDSVL